MLNANVAASYPYQRDAASGPVVPTGMPGNALVLGVGMTGVTKRVL